MAPRRDTEGPLVEYSTFRRILNVSDGPGKSKGESSGKIDGTQIGDVVRAAGLKPTNAMVHKASGQEYKRKGEKRITFDAGFNAPLPNTPQRCIVKLRFTV
jgi:hypothetical protein